MSPLKRLAKRLAEKVRASQHDLALPSSDLSDEDRTTQMLLVPLVTSADQAGADIPSFDALLVAIVRSANETPHSMRTLKLSVASLVPRISATVDRLVDEGRLVRTEDGLRPGLAELDA